MSQSTNPESGQTEQFDPFPSLEKFASAAFNGLDKNEKLFFALAVILVFLAIPITLRLQGDQLFYISLVLIIVLAASLIFLLVKAFNSTHFKAERNEAKASLWDTIETLYKKRSFLKYAQSSLNTVNEDLKEINPNNDNELAASESIQKNIGELIFKIDQELKSINEFLGQFQDYKQIQEVSDEHDDDVWQQARKS